jgi:hypothetical protein
MLISKQCKECLKHKKKTCKGKTLPKKKAKYFGTEQSDLKQTGLNFCSRYEFDEKLYEYPHVMESYKSIRVRQLKKQIAEETAEHIVVVDEAAGLSSKDFDDLVV